MERFVQLNLTSENDQSQTSNPPKQQVKAPDEVLKKLNRFANRAARKAGKQFGRSSGGIFTR